MSWENANSNILHNNMKNFLIIILVLALLAAVGFVLYKVRPQIGAPSGSNADTEFYGFVKLFPATNSVEIDEVELVSGKKATKTGEFDTGCPPDDTSGCISRTNNDFYIENPDDSTKVYPVADSAVVRVQKTFGSPLKKTISFADFRKEFFAGETLKASPYKFTKQGDTIVEIEQQFTP